MKRIILTSIMALLMHFSYAQDEVDIVQPQNSAFSPGNNIEGVIQNSINQTTGKVTFSLPIASIVANTVGYSVALTYNGAAAFETTKNTNQYNPTGVVGVGFNLESPKIVADYKDTAARDDDEFYLLDGNNTKLICTKKTNEVMEFETENYKPWKIQYHLGYIELIPTSLEDFFIEQFIPSDEYSYWTIVKEDGTKYQFGGTYSSIAPTEPAKSFVATWDNWIGSSNQTPKGKMVTEWYLHTISDQWDNKINFLYETVEGRQNSTQTNNFHTEALYIKEISSSNGTKATFTYGNKITQEYYEPHTEQIEPDAYQEQYEKKYLQSIKTYNASGELVINNKFEYEVLNATDPTKPYIAKRYLKKFIQENKNAEVLPAQQFEYNTSGDFAGGISKITYPTGGSVTYNYTQKLLFYNTANRFSGAQPDLANYYHKGTYTGDNYTLKIYRSKNEVTTGKYEFKIVRYQWNGNNWITNEFIIPYLLSDQILVDYGGGSSRYVWLDQFLPVFGENYYGFTYFDRTTNYAQVYLFHLNKDGVTWKTSTFNDRYMLSNNSQPYLEDPVFINGNDFIALGSKKEGSLYTYVWNGTDWNQKYKHLSGGEFYYAANNNFMLILNKNTANDIIEAQTFNDIYYFHYLNAEKEWETKSWTRYVTQRINGINQASFFYPSNSMAAFVADNNPEYFFRWDKNYDLIAIDNVLGGYDDSYPILPSLNGMFTLQHYPYKYPIKSLRYNGINWNFTSFPSPSYHTTPAYGNDIIAWLNDNTFSTDDKVSYAHYNPNNNSWDTVYLNNYDANSRWSSVGIIQDYIISGNEIYMKTGSIINYFKTLVSTFSFDVKMTYTNGYNYAYTSSRENLIFHGGDPSLIKTRFNYIDKKTGGISSINLDGLYAINGYKKFGGFTSFLSGNSIYLRNPGTDVNGVNVYNDFLYRIIDDQINQIIYDPIVSSIQIDNNKGAVRSISYQYDDFNLSSNDITYYGKVTTENKGFGNDSNGKVITFYNNGTLDIRLLGTPYKTEIRDINNNLKKEVNIIPEVITKKYNNSYGNQVGTGFYVSIKSKEEKLYLENNISTINNTFFYNDIGLLNRTETLNSRDEIIEASTEYAYNTYAFLADKNILNQPSKIIEKVNGVVTSTSETKWKEENSKAYPYQIWSGVETTKLLEEVTAVNNYGLVVEENDGKAIYNVNLMGYGNNYPVAKIGNATYNDVISNLEVSQTALQTLSTANLKLELLKLYSKLPKATITITLYDNNGNVINQIDSRKEEVYHYYDNFNRLKYTTDSSGNKLKHIEYKYIE
ncbi:MAG: hypothetical protein CVU01_04525 [Bacteroidetes bacterium HGW-Bacteroidetes-18]|nr:MAG: hypothetical protein CVU01_04525 [Bacteroidetes bacterium HGW-Bacteroidetes-18]